MPTVARKGRGGAEGVICRRVRIQSHNAVHGLETDVRFIAVPSVPRLFTSVNEPSTLLGL
jgi:hypothetical protein